MKKMAVIFPGIGYHTDKPLLYYSRQLAQQAGYEIREVPYKNFPPRIRGDREKMKEALEVGLRQAETILEDIQFHEYDSILFVSKSIGTAIATAYAVRHHIRASHLWYTPLAETFDLMGAREDHGEIMAFHGNHDPWAGTETLKRLSEEWSVPLWITEGGNHSLETGDALKDLQTVSQVMASSKKFLEELRS